MRQLTIAFDLDDVLVNLLPVLLRHYNLVYGTGVQASDWYGGDPLPWGVDTIVEATNRFRSIAAQIHHDLEPTPGSIKVVSSLSKQHDLYIVTGRGDEMRQRTEELVERYFPNCFKGVYFTSHFDHTRAQSKGEVCAEIKADILIDDHLDHVHSVLSSGLKEVILFGDYPWNQGQLPSGVVRCIDMSEVQREVERIGRL